MIIAMLAFLLFTIALPSPCRTMKQNDSYAKERKNKKKKQSKKILCTMKRYTVLHKNLIDAIKSTCLHCCTLLLKNGANPNTAQYDTPLNYAIRRHSGNKDDADKIVHLLLEYGADPNLKGFDTGNNALHVAALDKNYEMVKLFLEKKVDPNEKNGSREAPLHCAIKHHTRNIHSPADVTELLLLYKADPNVRNFWTEQPLHLAVRLNLIDVVKILIQNKANFHEKNNYEKTPLDIAQEKKNVEMEKLLQEYEIKFINEIY